MKTFDAIKDVDWLKEYFKSTKGKVHLFKCIKEIKRQYADKDHNVSDDCLLLKSIVDMAV